MRAISLLVPVTLVVVALAGCVSGGDVDPSADGGDASSIETEAGFGAIEGLVVSDEGLPVPGADVSLIETDGAARSDEGGRFAINNVKPGSYQIYVQKLGFESTGKRVDVAADDVAQVEFQLAPIAIAEPLQKTVTWSGFMQCSMGIWNLGWSEECGEGVGTPVGTFGKDPNNKIDWDFDQLQPVESILTETTWDPANDAASAMRVLIVDNLVCDPSCDWDKEYADTEDDSAEDGTPPVRLVVDGDDLPDDAAEYPVPLTVRHWAALGTQQEPVRLILEQPFEVYKTEFFGLPIEDVDETFSALPPA